MAVNYQTLSLSGATWVDVNSNFTLDGNPDLLPDVAAVANSIYNIVHCPIGSRGRLFQSTYGSAWWQFLQEPLDQTTATKMQMATINALAQWEPRIQIDNSNSWVVPNYTLPGYDMQIAYSLTLNGKTYAVQFSLQKP